MNKELADVIEKYSYMRKFTPEELYEMRENLSENVIKSRDLEQEAKTYSDSFKEQLKPVKEKIINLATNIKNKATSVTEDCFVQYVHEKGIAEIYNGEGELVGTRALKQEEKQYKLKAM